MANTNKRKVVYVNILQEAVDIIQQTAEVERRPQSNVMAVVLEDWAAGRKPSIQPAKIDNGKGGK